MIDEGLWAAAIDAVRRAREVVIACHINPDGDALGSMLGLGQFLKREGKSVWMTWGSPVVKAPPQYSFLPGLELVSDPGVVPDSAELFIAIDCGDKSRLELLEPKFASARRTLNVDHHISNPLFADINLVDPHIASSSELAYELIRRMYGEPNEDEATCLYTGMVTDTGRFQYSNTTAETLRTAASLRDVGFNHERIAADVYESSSFTYLRVLGVVLSRAKLDDGVVWSWVDQSDLEGLDLEETEHFIDVLRAVREADVAVVLKEQPGGGYKASLRSRGAVDVSAIAKHFKGGGHARAAGFTATGTPQEIIAAIQGRIAAASG